MNNRGKKFCISFTSDYYESGKYFFIKKYLIVYKYVFILQLVKTIFEKMIRVCISMIFCAL